jgi:hypothetical protein
MFTNCHFGYRPPEKYLQAGRETIANARSQIVLNENKKYTSMLFLIDADCQ